MKKRNLNSIIYVDKNVLSGEPCFKGTRVSVATILKHLAGGWSIPQLKQAYPTVKSKYISEVILYMTSKIGMSHGS